MARNLSSITSSEQLRADLPQWRIIGRTLLFALVIPVLCIFLLLEWLGWVTGETISPERAAEMQTQNPRIVWYGARTSNFARFKLVRVAHDRPDILIMGQSRPQMFRSAMFAPYREYNLGSLSYTMASFTDLLHHLPAGYNPKVIIMACDFYMFDPLCTKANLDAHMLQDFSPTTDEHLTNLRDLLVALPAHPGLLVTGMFPRAYPTLGLPAHLLGMGFRFDGSTHWFGHAGDNPHLDQEVPWGNVAMIQGDALGATELAQFENFVREAHQRGIAVVLLQMPMYHAFVHKMEVEEPEKYGILRDFREHIRDGDFDRLGVTVIDLLTMPGSDDYHYFIDTVHAKEGMTLQVMDAMASDPKFLALLPKLDVAALHEKAAAELTTDHNDVYGNF